MVAKCATFRPLKCVCALFTRVWEPRRAPGGPAMLLLKRSLVVIACVGFLPVTAWAQTGAIAGLVRDTSGGVLPGVAAEAASPALIERTRTVVTDDQGRYNIVDLRPGTYSVTFTLSGFSTFKREGLELSAATTLPLNAELKVGALAETLTVTGATPVVD